MSLKSLLFAGFKELKRFFKGGNKVEKDYPSMRQLCQIMLSTTSFRHMYFAYTKYTIVRTCIDIILWSYNVLYIYIYICICEYEAKCLRCHISCPLMTTISGSTWTLVSTNFIKTMWMDNWPKVFVMAKEKMQFSMFALIWRCQNTNTHIMLLICWAVWFILIKLRSHVCFKIYPWYSKSQNLKANNI